MSLSDFVILEKLGSGSFASVYKARRLIDQKIYALKKIDLKALGLREKNNALNEIRLLACLKSPYIIGYCESFFDEKLDILCIAMEYADGGDLYKKIEHHKKERTCISEIEIWKIFLHLLYGLNELHSRSILHRDLKSENVFIANQTYKIGDMNVSKIVKNGRLAQTQTGTPYYASPEVWNYHPYNEKSDIWSLGCILYEITTLRPPFEAKNMEKLFEQINNAPTPTIPKNYSKELQFFIDQCLQKNPNLRPSTKDILSHQSIKIYENMLIDCKPNLENQKKENLLLKTIYMPVVKKDLNNKLPQSNYKSDKVQTYSKELRKESSIKKTIEVEANQFRMKDEHHIENINPKAVEKIQPEKSDQLKSALTDIQPILSNIENLLNQNRSQQKNKNNSKNKNSSRSKEKSKSKRNEESATNRKRANSCKIFKDKENINHSSRKDLLMRAEMIIDSQKVTKGKLPTNDFLTEKKKGYLEKEKIMLNIIEEVIENDNFKQKIEKMEEKSLQPRKLIFVDDIKTESNQSLISNMEKTIKEKAKLGIENNQCREAEKLKIEKELDISSSPYLGDTIKNLSKISDMNHEYYNFKLEKDENKGENQNSFEKEAKESKIINRQLSFSPKIDIKNEEHSDNEIINSTPINILVDVNENYEKVCEEKIIDLKSSRKVDLIIGFEKIRCFYSKSILKISLSLMHNLKSLSVSYQLKDNKEKTVRKIEQEKLFEKISEEKVVLNINLEAKEEKTEIRRARSRSIPKLEKPKKKVSENQELNNFLLKKFSENDLPLKEHQSTKKCHIKKEESVKNSFNEKEMNLKEMALMPKYVNETQKPLKENLIEPIEVQEYYRTDHKQNRNPLIDKKINNITSSNQTSHKKIFPQSIFSQGSTEFDAKKRKIFEDIKNSNNLVHNLNNQIDRMNLERKMQKYINI